MKDKFIVTAHQPVLFPNNAFLGKMRDADIFELAIYDKYTSGKNLFSGRMNIGTEENITEYKIPIEKFQFGIDRICDIKLKNEYQSHLWEKIEEVYKTFPQFRTIGEMIKAWIFDVKHKYLWELDFHLLMRLKEFYGIKTPIAISEEPPLEGKTEDLLWLIDKYNASGYISGLGGKNYVEEEKFVQRGCELLYYERKSDRCSVLTRMFLGNYNLYDKD